MTEEKELLELKEYLKRGEEFVDSLQNELNISNKLLVPSFEINKDMPI